MTNPNHIAGTADRAGAVLAFPILFIGDTNRAEFRDAADWLSNHGAVFVPDISAALGTINDNFSPALILLASSRPGTFSANHIEQLRQAAPLARIVGLLGSWMEGEPRSGRPIAGMQRIYWYQWPRLADQLERLEMESGSPLAWPLTAGDDERLLAASRPVENTIGDLRVVIVARHRETAQSLADICSQSGWQSRCVQTISAEVPLDADVVLFDAINGLAFEIETVAKLHAEHPETSIIVLQGFPRTDDVDRWKAAGAAAVVSKPFLVTELIGQIERLIHVQGSTVSR